MRPEDAGPYWPLAELYAHQIVIPLLKHHHNLGEVDFHKEDILERAIMRGWEVAWSEPPPPDQPWRFVYGAILPREIEVHVHRYGTGEDFVILMRRKPNRLSWEIEWPEGLKPAQPPSHS